MLIENIIIITLTENIIIITLTENMIKKYNIIINKKSWLIGKITRFESELSWVQSIARQDI